MKGFFCVSDLKPLTGKRDVARAAAWLIIMGLLVSVAWLGGFICPVSPHSIRRTGPQACPQPVSRGEVKAVFDGDSLILECGAVVRLNGIDTPERDQTGYEEAKRALIRLVSGRQVELSYGAGEKVDRYGRLLAHLSTRSNASVNLELVRSGMAWIYRLDKISPRRSGYLDAQTDAIEKGRGIWDGFEDREGSFRASVSSHIFHKDSCVYAGRISDENLETFETLGEAFRHGYAPCRNCFKHPIEGW